MSEFDETQRAIAAALREYCASEIEPLVPALESGQASPYDTMRALARAFGFEEMIAAPLRSAARPVPGASSAGATGSGAAGFGDPTLFAIFAMELARVSPGLCLCVMANVGCGATIAARADAELVDRCAIPVLTLEKVGCWGLTEPGSGSDAFAMQTTVHIDGDEVVVHGSKAFISNAPAADVFLIYGRLIERAGATMDKRRIFPVVVERGTTGLTTGPPLPKLGMHASPTGDIFLDDVRVPRSHLLGDPDRPARDVAEGTLVAERTAIVAMSLGVIERCLDDSVAYAVERVQFGKPIAAFQLIQQKLARMHVARANVRNALFRCLWLQRARRTDEAEVSGAKWYATETACEVALDAMQLMGGAGYVRGQAPERLFRDMKLWTIGGGTSEIQQLTIAKELLRERGFIIDLDGGFGSANRRR